MRVFLSILVVLLLLAAAGFGAAWWEDRHFAAAGPSDTEKTVLVRPGESLRAMADDLAAARVVDNALLFRIGVIRRGAAAALKAGEYAVPARASPAEVMALLISHHVVQHRLTIAEGLTSAMAVVALKAETALDGAVPDTPLEGSLLPETYLFERGTARAEILRRMHKAQVDFVARLWPRRKRGLPYMSENDALTLASIVEKESAIPAERPHIAAVFINRLKMGMKLESDPTIIYGLTRGIPLGHPLRQSELAAPNPYSTYQIEGLPPTPICNPGKDAISAVLNPSDSDDLYFVADGSGGHVFAKTFAQHERNVAAYRKLERAQPGDGGNGRLR